jgi:hypothetical protein
MSGLQLCCGHVAYKGVGVSGMGGSKASGGHGHLVWRGVGLGQCAYR